MEVREGYKKTEIGVIPEDWEVKEFGEIFKVIGGGAFKSGDSQQTGVKWLKIANVGINIIKWDEQSYLPKHLIQENKKFLLREGDYVLALTRPILDRKLKISKLKRNDVPALLNQRVGKIEPIGDNNIDYIYFLLQQHTSISSLLQSMAGTDPPNLGNKGIYAILSGIPKTKKEQKAIAEVLSDTDNLIQALEKRIAKKRLIKQGAMQKLLTPKDDWEIKKLGLECDLVTKGTTPTSIGKNFCKNGINFIKVESLKANGKFIQEMFAYIDEETHFILKRSQLKENDLLISIAGALGRTGIVKKDVLPANTNQALAIIRMKEKSIFYLNYVFYCLRTERICKHIEAISVQGAQPNLSLQNIYDLPIYFPKSKQKQTRITTILSDIDIEIETLEKKLAKYKQLKQGLMQELHTGKTRLM